MSSRCGCKLHEVLNRIANFVIQILLECKVSGGIRVACSGEIKLLSDRTEKN
jgi:hypothetical protein